VSLIDILIVNWNSGEQLARCLESIDRKSTELINFVIVVDNKSNDDSLSLIENTKWPFKLKLSKQDSNVGFGRACNIGAGLSNAPFILLLNPDTRIYEDTLSKPLNYLLSLEGKDCAVCGIQLRDENGIIQKHCARFPSLKTYFGQSTGLNVLFPRQFPYVFLDDFDHQSSRDVEHCIGAFYMIRRNVFDTLGGFDERFFVYLEDLDLSLRVHHLGWRIHYLADASAFHKGGGTSEKVKAHRLFYSLKSRILYSFKHFERVEAYCVAFMALFVEPVPRLLQCLFIKRSILEVKNTILGYSMLWRDLLSNKKRRKYDK